jgi:hypothetical protein
MRLLDAAAWHSLMDELCFLILLNCIAAAVAAIHMQLLAQQSLVMSSIGTPFDTRQIIRLPEVSCCEWSIM